MSATLLSEVLSLNPAERLAVADAIWESLSPDSRDIPTADWHMQIVEERLANYEADPTSMVSWADAKAEIMKGRER